MSDKKSNGSQYNGSGNGKDPNADPDTDDDKIVQFTDLIEQRKVTQEQEAEWRKDYERERKRAEKLARKGQPMFNIRPATKILILSFLAVHVIIHIILSPAQIDWVFTYFAFRPAAFTGDLDLPFWSMVISPFSYAFIHGNMFHLGVNAVMLLAFGSGLERAIGAKRTVIFFFGCSLLALLAHFVFNMGSFNPLVGASGGLSGFFAAILIVMQKAGAVGRGKYGLWPIIAFWVGISVVFGLMTTPSMIGGGATGADAEIAWIAHLGGFLAGFILFKPVMRLKP